MTVAAPDRLPVRVAAACRRLCAGARGDLLLAVSAGADSTALACLLAEGMRGTGDRQLVLGHVDHGWRGADEAAADRAALEALAARLRLPLAVSAPPPASSPRTEAAARRWRYRQLAAMAHEHACGSVATAHHVGDQAETFLLRLLRGSGLTGLAGIPAQRELQPGSLRVVRPLLEEDPSALRAWLAQRGIRWREDPTNRDLSRQRAAIRARLAARAAAGQTPALAALAERLARRLAQRTRRIEALVGEQFRWHELAAAVEVPRDLLRSLRGEDLALALRLAGRPLHAQAEGPWFVRRHVAIFARLLEHGGQLDLPRGLFLHVGGRSAWLARRKAPPGTLPRLTRQDVPRSAFDLPTWCAQGHRAAAALDARVLGPEPVLRRLRPEDRFRPHGHGARRAMRVRDWLAKRGIPAFVRRAQLVVVGAHGVAWVVGRRIDAGHAVRAQTARVARLELASPTGPDA